MTRLPRRCRLLALGLLPLAQDANCGAGGRQLCDELPDDARDAYGQPIAQAAGLQTGNPGFPGFQSWGHLVAIGVDAKWLF